MHSFMLTEKIIKFVNAFEIFNINHTCTCMVCILQCVLLIDRLPPLVLEFKS